MNDQDESRGPFFAVHPLFAQGVAAAIPRGISGDLPFRDVLMAAVAHSLWVTPDHPAVRRVKPEDV